MVTRPPRRTSWAISFQYRDFRLLWASNFLYDLGHGMEQLALGWLVFDLTGSAFMVGVAFAARQAPYFFLGILSGAMNDWLERRLFLRFIGLGASIGAGLMALLLLSDLAQVWSIIAMVALTGGIFMFKQTVDRQR